MASAWGSRPMNRTSSDDRPRLAACASRAALSEPSPISVSRRFQPRWRQAATAVKVGPIPRIPESNCPTYPNSSGSLVKRFFGMVRTVALDGVLETTVTRSGRAPSASSRRRDSSTTTRTWSARLTTHLNHRGQSRIADQPVEDLWATEAPDVCDHRRIILGHVQHDWDTVNTCHVNRRGRQWEISAKNHIAGGGADCPVDKPDPSWIEESGKLTERVERGPGSPPPR